MAEWCDEIYTIRFPEASRKDFALDDPLYKASEYLRGFLDLEESGYTEGAPLSIVMDSLGYKGDRSGLTERSAVDDIIVGGNSLSFVVRDNFTQDFNICRSLAKAVGVDLVVDVQYRFSEGPDYVCESPLQHYVARDPNGVAKDIQRHIESTLHYFSDHGKPVEFQLYSPFERMLIESVGPEPDRINLVRDGIHLEDTDNRRSIRIGDIDNLWQLEYLDGLILQNFENLAYEFNLDYGKKLREGSIDVAQEREDMLEQLYKSSSAYQNVSEFMMGFDITFSYAKVADELSPERALEAARAEGLEGEVQEELSRGLNPYQALHEWDVPFPEPEHEPDILSLRYDGDRMMDFAIIDDGLWQARNVDPGLVDFFKDKTGIDLNKEFGFGADYVGTEGVKVMEVSRKALLSPQNRQMFKEASIRCARKYRSRQALDKFVAGTLDLSKGKHM